MINEVRKELPASILMLAFLLLGSWYFFSDIMNTYPSYIHAWTQTDRLALAMNFQENGFDLFHPATYSLLTKDGITQVDFPIHDYLIACLSSFLKLEIIPIFRGYNLIYSLIGLFYFFRTNLLMGTSAKRAVFSTLFLFTLPFFVYYQNGFLPSAPSVANLFIGVYFLVKARKLFSAKTFATASLFISLAALSRSPFFIFLFALFLQEVYVQWKRKKINFRWLFPPLLGIITFLGYFFYNQHLKDVYGTMFLTDWLNFESYSDFRGVLSIAADRWGKQILSPFHLILLFSLLVTFIVQRRGQTLKNGRIHSLLIYMLLSSLGVLLFFIAFGKQFADHDYYYLDTFLPLLSILLLITVNQVKIEKTWYTPVALICGIFVVNLFSFSKSILDERYTPSYDDRVEYAYTVYKNSKGDLRKWGVGKKDTLYVLEANSTNMPFTIWGNRGFTNLNSSEEVLTEELTLPFNYALLIDSFFRMSTLNDYPEIIRELDWVNGNGELSLYKKSKNKDIGFFENLIYHGYSNFDERDNIPDSVSAWTAEEIVVDSFGNSLVIKEENLYTLSIRNKLKKINSSKPIRAHVTGDFYQYKDSTKLRIVGAVNNYHHAHYLETHLDSSKGWQHRQFDFNIPPKYFEEDDELVIYFWNPEKEKLAVDNFKILIYQ